MCQHGFLSGSVAPRGFSCYYGSRSREDTRHLCEFHDAARQLGASLQRRETDVVQPKRDLLVKRSVPQQAEDGGSNVCWRQRRASKKLLDRAALATRIRFDGPTANAALRTDRWEESRKPNAELYACNILRDVLGQESDHRFSSGIASAQRRATHRSS